MDEYYKLKLVLGREPLLTPTPTPDPNATETPIPEPDVTETPTPTPSPTPIPYDKTITATISAADLEALEEDEDGNIAIAPTFELNNFKLDKLPMGTYEIEEINAGGYTLKSFEDITPDGSKKAYVEVAGNGKSATIYLNQVVSGVPANATIDSTRQRLNAQKAVLKVVNTNERGLHLKLTKKDSVDGSILENVVFEIFEDAACTTKVSGTLDAAGNEANVFTMDENGTLTIDNLHPEKNTTYTSDRDAADRNTSDGTGTPSITGTPSTTGSPSVSKKPTITQKPTATRTPSTTTPRTPSSSSGDSTSKGDSTRSTTTTTTSVKTGDDSPVELYTVMAVAALLILIWMMKKKA